MYFLCDFLAWHYGRVVRRLKLLFGKLVSGRPERVIKQLVYDSDVFDKLLVILFIKDKNMFNIKLLWKKLELLEELLRKSSIENLVSRLHSP